jgi:hypothetical protein
VVCGILVTLTLSAVLVHFADVLGIYTPELQLYCCRTQQMKGLADGAIHDPDYLPDLVTHGAVRNNFSVLLYCIKQNHSSKLTMQMPFIISNHTNP